MRKIIAFLFPLLSMLSLKAQGYDWAKSFGGPQQDFPCSIAHDAMGNVYIAGSFEGTADFDPGVGVTNRTSEGSFDMFILKLDSLGNFVNVQTIGGLGWQEAQSLIVDDSGYIYLAGKFYSSIDLDPRTSHSSILTATGAYDAFVVKYNTDFVPEWNVHLGGSSNQIVKDICVNKAGEVFVSGNSDDTLNLNSSISGSSTISSFYTGAYLFKLNTSGQFEWINRFYSWAYSASPICCDESGNVYVSGTFYGTVYFGTGTITDTLHCMGTDADIYIVKFDSSGNLIFAKAIHSNDREYVGDIAYWNNAIYFVGNFEGTVYFDPSDTTYSETVATGTSAGYFCSLSSSGELNFVNHYQASSDCWITCIEIYPYSISDAAIYLGGGFIGTVDFDETSSIYALTTAPSIYEGFALRTTTSGNLFYAAKFYGGAKSITGTRTGPIISGTFSRSGDFDPGQDSVILSSDSFSTDVFVERLKYCAPITHTITEISCSPYTSSINGVTYTTSGEYMLDTLSAANRCDSVVVLNLSIQLPDVNVTVVPNSNLTSEQDSAASVHYQWIDCATSTLLDGANSKTYYSDTSGNFAVIVHIDACVDTSACNNIQITAINEVDDETLLVYPNITKQNVMIKTTLDITEMELYDVAGNKLRSINGLERIIQFDNLPSGGYWLIVKVNSTMQRTFKIIKK